MHIHFEDNKARADCTIQALSWMGRVPDVAPDHDPSLPNPQSSEENEEGWLASGNARGTLGITLTATHGCTKRSDSPTRANFNLRGHRSEVSSTVTVLESFGSKCL